MVHRQYAYGKRPVAQRRVLASASRASAVAHGHVESGVAVHVRRKDKQQGRVVTCAHIDDGKDAAREKPRIALDQPHRHRHCLIVLVAVGRAFADDVHKARDRVGARVLISK